MELRNLFQSFGAKYHQDFSPYLVVLAFGNVRTSFPLNLY